MILGYRGSVNRWECDENDHLNVRFHVEKHWQALNSALDDLGLVPDVAPSDLSARMTVQHLRFLAEARLAAPLSGYVCVVNGPGRGSVDILTELQQTFTGQVISTCVHRVLDVAGSNTRDLPANAGSRGIADQDCPYVSLNLDQTDRFGFRTIGGGVVQADECGPDERLRIHHFMGRISDSMPHLWGELNAESGILREDEGGAVLEYRMRYHAPLRLHDRFIVRSGISGVGAKVQHFTHLLFNAHTGKLCLSAQAAGVRMDLQARKATVVDEVTQAALRKQMLLASA